LDMYPNVGAYLQESADFQYIGRVEQEWYG
jgi:hypothetical protein